MEEILTLRDKYLHISAFQYTDLLENKFQLISKSKNEQDQYLNENHAKIHDLTSKIEAMKENLQSQKQMLEEKNQDLCRHLESVKELENDKSKFEEEKKVLQIQTNKLKASKPSAHDQKLMDNGRRKFQLYKDFTGIRWDYAVLHEKKIIEGYVTNKSDYIHHFSYAADDNKLTDHLWKEIQQSIKNKPTAEIQDKENNINN